MDTPEGWVLLHSNDKHKTPLYLKRSAVIAVGQDEKTGETLVGVDGSDGTHYCVTETPDEALAAITAGR